MIVESHLPNPHCYADDTQLYIAFRREDDLGETAALTAMESCIADFSQWMHTLSGAEQYFGRNPIKLSIRLNEYQ